MPPDRYPDNNIGAGFFWFWAGVGIGMYPESEYGYDEPRGDSGIYKGS